MTVERRSRSEEALVLAALARRDDVPDHGDRGHDQPAAADPWIARKAISSGMFWASPAERRADQEDDDRRLEDDPASVEVAELAAGPTIVDASRYAVTTHEGARSRRARRRSSAAPSRRSSGRATPGGGRAAARRRSGERAARHVRPGGGGHRSNVSAPARLHAVRRILVAYDDSDGARRALRRAIEEAHDERSRITILAVARMPLDPHGPRNFGTLGDISAREGRSGGAAERRVAPRGGSPGACRRRSRRRAALGGR